MSACCAFLAMRVRRSADFLKLFVYDKTGSKRVFAFLTCDSQASRMSHIVRHTRPVSRFLCFLWRAAVRLSPPQFCFATRLYFSASLVHKWPLSFPLLPPFFHTLPLIWYFFQSIFCLFGGLFALFCSFSLTVSLSLPLHKFLFSLFQTSCYPPLLRVFFYPCLSSSTLSCCW